jgi:hypothetical protein
LPIVPVDPANIQPFDCDGELQRHPRETKGIEYRSTFMGEACC